MIWWSKQLFITVYFSSIEQNIKIQARCWSHEFEKIHINFKTISYFLLLFVYSVTYNRKFPLTILEYSSLSIGMYFPLVKKKILSEILVTSKPSFCRSNFFILYVPKKIFKHSLNHSKAKINNGQKFLPSVYLSCPTVSLYEQISV